MTAIKILMARTAGGQRVRSILMALTSLWGLWTISTLPRGSLLGMFLALTVLAMLFWAIGTFILSTDSRHYEQFARRARGD